MAPRHFTNPPPKTESAKELRKTFFCELCQKGYSRMNELETHQMSYDHAHKQRLKDMKQISKDPNATEKARRAERKADEKSGLITIKPLKLDAAKSTSGFKKGGFKNAFAPAGDSDTSKPAPGFKKVFEDDAKKVAAEDQESDFSDVDYERYDPRRPTGCGSTCAGKH